MNPRQQRVIPHQLNLTRQPMALAMPTHLKIEIETASRRLNTSSLGPTCLSFERIALSHLIRSPLATPGLILEAKAAYI